MSGNWFDDAPTTPTDDDVPMEMPDNLPPPPSERKAPPQAKKPSGNVRTVKTTPKPLHQQRTETAPLPTRDAPPHDDDAEEEAIGQMLRDPHYTAQALARGLKPDHFHDGRVRGRIYWAICEVHENKQRSHDAAYSWLDVADLLHKHRPNGPGTKSSLEIIGEYSKGSGKAELRRLLDVGFVDDSAYSKIQKIKSLAEARATLVAIAESEAEIRNCKHYEMAEVLKTARARISTLRVEDSSAIRVPRVIDDIHNTGTEASIVSGFPRLDVMAGPMYAGLTVVAGLGGSGKSSFVSNMAASMAQDPQGAVLVFTMDVKRREYVRQMVYAGARLDTSLLADKMDQDAAGRLEDSAKRVAALPMWFDERRGLTVPQIESTIFTVQGEAARMGRKLTVVIDYLQLLKGGRGEEVPWQLADVASDRNVPLIATSALIERYRPKKSAEVETLGTDGPQLADVPPAVSAAASRVILVYNYAAQHRAEVFFDGTTPRMPEPERVVMIVAKNKRGGGIGRLEMTLHPHMGLIEDKGPEASKTSSEPIPDVEPEREEPSFGDEN